MSNFASLEIGKRALLAQQYGLDITSNNIANVNTPGYSRRTTVMSETDPISTSAGFIGTGTIADTLKNFREEYFDRDVRNALSSNSGYNSDSQVLQKVEAILAEPSDQGLSEIASQFINSFEELSTKPEDVAIRQNTIDLAHTLVDRFHNTSDQLIDARSDVLKSINTDVTKANDLIKQVASLNKQIAGSINANGATAQTYMDQREKALEDLSQIAGITVTQGDYGQQNVFLNGINLVTAANYSQIQVSESAITPTGERTVNLQMVDDKGLLTNLNPQTGELNSLMKHYNVTLDPSDTSGGYSITKNLDDYVNAIVQKVNGFTSSGYGLDDAGPNPPGRSFFTPTVGNATAHSIEINPDIFNNPRNIPLSSVPNEPGNNDIARQIALISKDNTFLNSQNPSNFYSGFIGKVGTMLKDAQNGATTTKLVSDQTISQRESIIGVNQDEEAVNLIKFQKAFEAAARVVNTTNEVLSTIVNLGK